MRVGVAVGAIVLSFVHLGCGGAVGANDLPAADSSSGATLCVHAEAPSRDLGCTGLYRDTLGGELGAGVVAYDPSLHLWSDGADKSRFVYLPPGTRIDTSDMDHWIFPVGTRLWKEFSVSGKHTETRYQEKLADGSWDRTVFVWSADQASAVETTGGISNLGGKGYDVPATTACKTCHEGATDGILGFEAVGLSTPEASGLTMSVLVQRGLVTHAPAAPITIPGNPTEAAALGWLHANCGNACHNATKASDAGWTGLHMRLLTAKMSSVQETDTWTTAVGVRSAFQPPGGGFLRIAPGDSAHSAIVYRASHRDSGAVVGVQMPPLGTHAVDTRGVAEVVAWIDSM